MGAARFYQLHEGQSGSGVIGPISRYDQRKSYAGRVMEAAARRGYYATMCYDVPPGRKDTRRKGEKRKWVKGYDWFMRVYRSVIDVASYHTRSGNAVMIIHPLVSDSYRHIEKLPQLCLMCGIETGGERLCKWHMEEAAHGLL